jgi:aromatic-amino-acid transaminase
MFQHVDAYAGDPILSLNEDFQRDPRPHKINLSIGIYLDEAGKLPALDAVHQAETAMAAANRPKPYLPMEGAPAFRAAVQTLLFGADHEAVTGGRIATVQTVGSSGGLKLGADFLKRWLPASCLRVSAPSWDNHRALFSGAGLPVLTYPYYDADSGGVDFEAMIKVFTVLPPDSLVLLHACCHNPTGADLTPAQWTALIPVIKSRGLIPFLDLAYQGFGAGLAEDAFAVRALADTGISFLVANSFSKSMSVYGERCGALSVVCPDADQAGRVLGQLKLIVRRTYSSPPIHGGEIVTRVLTTPALRQAWERDLGTMRDRLRAMRVQLHAALTARMPDTDFGYLLSQRGMFSFTGLRPNQVDHLRENNAIYLVRSGRLCVAGLTSENCDIVAGAISDTLKTVAAIDYP